MAKRQPTVTEAAAVETLRVEARTSARLDSLERRIEGMEGRLEAIEERTSSGALTTALGVLESRLASLERSVREPKTRPKDRLPREEWLSQRREIMRENAAHRWSKKRKAAAKPTEPAQKRKATKR